MRDKYNLNTLPASANDADDIATGDDSNQIPMIPGMAPEDRVEVIPGLYSLEIFPSLIILIIEGISCQVFLYHIENLCIKS